MGIAGGVFEVVCVEIRMTWDHGKEHTTFQLIINDAKALTNIFIISNFVMFVGE